MAEYKRYEILDSLPTYGPMHVSVTDNDQPFYGEGFPVRFYKTNGNEWVANFKPGWTKLNKIYELESEDKILVIAGGIGYFMSPDNEKALGTVGIVINEIIETENGSLVCADDISILFLDNSTGEQWRSERISWDGIEDLRLNGDIVSGKSFDPMHSEDREWVEFSLNLKTKEIVGGSYRESVKLNPGMPTIHLENENQRKSWWKIW